MHQLLIPHRYLPRIFHRDQGVPGERPGATVVVVRRQSPQDNAGIGKKARQRQRKEERANGGCLGYPEARKDVVSCEKPRGFANRN